MSKNQGKRIQDKSKWKLKEELQRKTIREKRERTKYRLINMFLSTQVMYLSLMLHKLCTLNSVKLKRWKIFIVELFLRGMPMILKLTI